MEVLDTSIVADLLNSISPLAISLGVTFATAEFIFQWFLRIVFAKSNRNAY